MHCPRDTTLLKKLSTATLVTYDITMNYAYDKQINKYTNMYLTLYIYIFINKISPRCALNLYTESEIQCMCTLKYMTKFELQGTQYN